MSTELVTYQAPQIALARGIDAAAWNALKELYDGASDQSVALAHDYCKARRLDPMKKPVHIVPVWSSRRKQMVDTIWPSIAEARITAMRTKLYAGRDETKFGPNITMDVGHSKNFTFPEWAQVTVYRLVAIGDKIERIAFPGPRVYWLESYAKQGKEDYSPNSMWGKRTWAQLDKCAEAAALRAAFPEELGGEPTAEEMHGREIDDNHIEVTTMAPLDQQQGTPAAEGQGAAPAAEQATTPRRAAVPRKAKGAAGMKEEPKPVEPVEPAKTVDNTPAAEQTAATPPAAEEPKPADPAPAAEPAPAAKVEPVEEKPAEEPKRVAPSVDAKPSTNSTIPPGGLATLAYPRYPQTPGWPKVLTVTVIEALDKKGKNDAGEVIPVKVCRFGKEGKDLGAVIFDPQNPVLAEKFARVGEAEVKATIEQWPSTSQPGRFLTVVVGAEDEVMM